MSFESPNSAASVEPIDESTVSFSSVGGSPCSFAELPEKAVLPTPPELKIERAIIFSLITQILPLEICLYHRVLPLQRSKRELTLGMVDPCDEEALTYVARMVAYQGLTLKPLLLSGTTHQLLLSAYLSYIGQPAEAEQRNAESGLVDWETDGAAGAGAAGAEVEGAEAQTSSPRVADPEETLFTPAEETLFLTAEGAELQSAPLPNLSQPVDHRSTLQLDVTDVSQLRSQPSLPPTKPNGLPSLYAERQHWGEPLEALALLPAPQFLAELLGRILGNGITRVLFGSTGGPGRIAWDWNGSAQLALGQIEPQVFRALTAELKVLVGLPAQSVQQPLRRQVMRAYEGQPVMLKLCVEPIGLNAMRSPLGPGEKIQMQVLRGARLIAHEQQRLAQLERETAELSNLLRHKLQQRQVIQQTLPMLALKPS